MNKSNIAQFQLLDSYVKEFGFNILDNSNKNNDFKLDGQVTFTIESLEKEEDNNKYFGVIKLENDITINYKKQKKGNIHISMIGNFVGNDFNDQVEFERMLKLNGSATLSHLIRAYIYSVTGLSGISNIVTPMINYQKMFEEEEEK